MVALLVKRVWINELGKLAEGLLLYVHSESLNVAYASKVQTEYPFVYAELARDTEPKTFVPVHIPADAIRGMFNMDPVQEKKLGF